MDNNNKNPEIRFKGFTEDWDVDRFENLTTINQGLQIAISNRYTKPVKGSYFYITNEFLKKGSKSQYYILAPSESVLCTENDVLMTRTGNTGEVVTNVKGAFHNNFFKIKFNPKEIDKDFLVYFLKLDSTQLLIRQLAGNSTIPDLNHNDFYRIKISFPKPTEQKQIGKFFQNLDNLITLHQKKYDKLVILKKAMLVKMFPKKGALIPEIRFKGFSGDWEHTELNKTSWFQEGPGLRNWQFTQQGIKVINVTNLVNGVLKLENTSRYISYSEFEKTYKHFEIQANDIVVASSGNSYGKVSIVRECDLPLLMNTSVIRFKPLLNLDFNYLLLFLKSDMFKNQIDLLITGGAQPNFGPVHLNKLKINLPPKIEEQQKIGQYFQNLDNQIDLHKTQLDKLITIKKACFSKMFVGQD